MSEKAGTSQKPENKKGFSYTFKQQIMKAWQPVPTLGSTIILFSVLTVFFLIFGVVLKIYSNSVQEYSTQYFPGDCQSQVLTCTTSLKVQQDMDGPVYVYYELTDFYQNHRRYVKSRSVDQLQGDQLGVSDVETDCDPVVRNRDLNVKFAYDGVTPLNADSVAHPCGLIAKSYFNDTFSITGLTISQQGIAWPSDKENQFKNGPGNWQTYQWLDVEDERFMVWMRTAALPNFRQLWGKIEGQVQAGVYSIAIQNNYDVSQFDGTKRIVLSTANAFGGKNEFLAITYLIVGGFCCLVTVFFIIKKFQMDQQKTK